MVILDTNIVIDHIRRDSSANSLLMRIAKKVPKEELALSVISVQELYEGKSTLKEGEENKLLAVITPLKILAYTYDVAQLAGEIARDLKSSIEFPDAAIAATTIINGGHLATLNKKDFLGIENLDFYL